MQRRAFLALLSLCASVRLAWSAPKATPPAPRFKQRYYAEAHVTRPSGKSMSMLSVCLIDTRVLDKQWVGTIPFTGTETRALVRDRFENLRLSILSLAQEETQDFVRHEANTELMIALRPHYQGLAA
jgi:hypothetical protein